MLYVCYIWFLLCWDMLLLCLFSGEFFISFFFNHKWVLNFVKGFLCIYVDIIMWFLAFNLLIWCITLIDLWILENPWRYRNYKYIYIQYKSTSILKAMLTGMTWKIERNTNNSGGLYYFINTNEQITQTEKWTSTSFKRCFGPVRPNWYLQIVTPQNNGFHLFLKYPWNILQNRPHPRPQT